jgi:hypothetical protein
MELGKYARGRKRINIPGAAVHELNGSEMIESTYSPHITEHLFNLKYFV